MRLEFPQAFHSAGCGLPQGRLCHCQLSSLWRSSWSSSRTSQAQVCGRWGLGEGERPCIRMSLHHGPCPPLCVPLPTLCGVGFMPLPSCTLRHSQILGQHFLKWSELFCPWSLSWWFCHLQSFQNKARDQPPIRRVRVEVVPKTCLASMTI